MERQGQNTGGDAVAMKFDAEVFEERAAWLQYSDGMSRFQAEVEAARRQGVERWEVLRECKKHHTKS